MSEIIDYPAYNELKDDYSIAYVIFPDQINEIGELRYIAWKDEKGINKNFFAQGKWIDEFDKHSHLWVIRYGGKVIASARLSIHHTIENIPWHECIPAGALKVLETPVASMNRLTVHPLFRKKGLSKPLDLLRIQKAKELNARTIIAEPVLARSAVLARYGFQDYGMFGNTNELPGVVLGFKMLKL